MAEFIGGISDLFSDGTISKVIGQFSTGVSGFAAARTRSALNAQRASAARLAAKQEVEAGLQEYDALLRRSERNVASQRAVLAARGISVTGTTAVELLSQSAVVGKLDALTALTNAERRAATLMQDSSLFRAESKAESRLSFQSLLSAGSDIQSTLSQDNRFQQRLRSMVRPEG